MALEYCPLRKNIYPTLSFCTLKLINIQLLYNSVKRPWVSSGTRRSLYSISSILLRTASISIICSMYLLFEKLRTIHAIWVTKVTISGFWSSWYKQERLWVHSVWMYLLARLKRRGQHPRAREALGSVWVVYCRGIYVHFATLWAIFACWLEKRRCVQFTNHEYKLYLTGRQSSKSFDKTSLAQLFDIML